MLGFVYVMSNPAFEAIKIGCSSKDPTVDRRKELSGASGVPEDFKCEYYLCAENYRLIEKTVHQELNSNRTRPDREFFNCTIPDAIQTIRAVTLRVSKIEFEKVFYTYRLEIDGGVYIGETKDGKQRHGKGKFDWEDGCSYEGMWQNNTMHGDGTLSWPKGSGSLSYTGNFENGDRSGFGIYHWKNGDKYEGNWHKNEMSGKGKYFSKGQLIFEGEYENNKKNGKGTLYENGNVIYDGDFKDGKRHGSGQEFLNNECIFEGTLSEGMAQGSGKLTLGDFWFHGSFAEDRPASGSFGNKYVDDCDIYLENGTTSLSDIKKFERNRPIHLGGVYAEYYSDDIIAPNTFPIHRYPDVMIKGDAEYFDNSFKFTAAKYEFNYRNPNVDREFRTEYFGEGTLFNFIGTGVVRKLEGENRENADFIAAGTWTNIEENKFTWTSSWMDTEDKSMWGISSRLEEGISYEFERNHGIVHHKDEELLFFGMSIDDYLVCKIALSKIHGNVSDESPIDWHYVLEGWEDTIHWDTLDDIYQNVRDLPFSSAIKFDYEFETIEDLEETAKIELKIKKALARLGYWDGPLKEK